MAAELHPPAEAHNVSTSTAVVAATTTVETVIPSAANSAVLLLPQPESTVPPPPAPKRQRRPSVRLGEIGDQVAALSYDSHQQPRRVKHQTWRHPKEPSSSKTLKARSLTNLVNGNEGFDGEEVEGNQNGEFVQRRKAKRGPPKRPRSSWALKVESLEEKVSREDREEEGEEEEVFRDFDPDPGSDTHLKGQESPFQSFDTREAAFDTWGRRTGEYETGGSGEGVRSWLFELGLSRYAPVFEVHEVDDEVLPWLTLEDLKDMGINAVGSRRKLYSAIQKLRKG